MTRQFVMDAIKKNGASSPEALVAAIEARERIKWVELKGRLLRYSLIASTILGAGGVGIWQLAPERLETVQPADVQKTVDKRVDELETSIEGCSGRKCTKEEVKESVKGKLETLGVATVEQKVQMVDGFSYIGDKLDVIHPEAIDAVTKPETLKAVETEVADIKKSDEVEKLFKGNGDD